MLVAVRMQNEDSGDKLDAAPFKLTSNNVRETLRELLAATQECVLAEEQAKRALAEQIDTIRKTHAATRTEVQAVWDRERVAATEEQTNERTSLAAQFDAHEAAIEKEFASTSAEIVLQYEREEATTTKEFQESGWTLEAIYDAHKKQAKEKFATVRRTFADQRSAAATIRESVASRLDEWQQVPVAAPGSVNVSIISDHAAASAERIATAREYAKKLDRLIAPGLLIRDRILHIGIFLAVALLVLLGLMSHFVLHLTWPVTILVALVGGIGLGAASGFALKWILSAKARNGIRANCEPLYRALAEADAIAQQAELAEEKSAKSFVESEKEKYRTEVRNAEKQHRQKLAAALERRDGSTRDAGRKRETEKVALTERRRRVTADMEIRHREKLERINAIHGGDLQRADDESARQSAQTRKQFNEAFADLSRRWRERYEVVKNHLAAIESQNRQYFPDWSSVEWSSWQPPRAVPPSLRFGSLDVTLPALPQDAQLEKPPAKTTIPALLPFPDQSSTLIHASGPARPAGAQALLSMATRFLTSLPAGKVRLTIIDPVNLGESFAALMQLADDDPQLVGARIWTEQPQIEKRLSDLTAHMENVIQKYLRNQYASIEEYNAQAGEVAEPYRVLVVANFPANFSSEAARRLERIATSGASCGVFTLVSFDATLPMPQGFDPADLIRASLNLRWQGERFGWEDSDFGAWPLTIDVPPTQAVLNSTLARIGASAKDANRVEVDFAFIAPTKENRWKGDSRAGIDVALGRAGATKRQHLRLGQGTAQHVVVAGKTGSGKSTLLHALITNLALTYSPEEIELYLIDFKKGVEFKTYASQNLPHARVIAVESEREFGLSVLQRLDQELKRRGEMFRQAGVQDVKGYREATGDAEKLPRILLIVDEFQEYFVEDDRVAQESALLLDRLVRQGRAFGLHVLLGSQTLGGAYSLARSTIDQMAVRIALQCSEADAGLILSKDNNAARLLSRPGEAIYNDANGLIEGNDIFQVVWLPEERREEYLRDIHEAAQKIGYMPPAPTVVFEGNVPSDMVSDQWLAGLLTNPSTNGAPREVVCRLGDAMAIKAPTAAVFRRQSSSNLLVLGQQPEPARALIVAAVLAVLGQQSPSHNGDAPRVVLLDGTPADDIHAGYFERAFAGFPGLTLFSGRDAAAAVDLVHAEYERRVADATPAAASLIFVVYGLHRIKDLRKAEEDFGFRRGEGGSSPAQKFATVLREGPATGIHIVAWCDTLVNAQRSFERAAMREFEMKVLFQMSANDSSTLIDSPMASRLGVNRALFAHEELTAPEKFRPYTIPPDSWLDDAKRKLIQRGVGS